MITILIYLKKKKSKKKSKKTPKEIPIIEETALSKKSVLAKTTFHQVWPMFTSVSSSLYHANFSHICQRYVWVAALPVPGLTPKCRAAAVEWLLLCPTISSMLLWLLFAWVLCNIWGTDKGLSAASVQADVGRWNHYVFLPTQCFPVPLLNCVPL